MSKHIGYPGDRLILDIEVVSFDAVETDFGIVRHYNLRTPAGDMLFWKASRDSKQLQAGQSYKVKASVRGHDSDDSGGKRTIVSHVVEYKEPPRIPRVAVGTARRR